MPAAQALTRPAPRAQPGSAWLFNPVVDYVCVGGLTFLVLLPIVVLNITAPTPETIGSLMIWSNILINCPHYAATYYRVYRDTNQVWKYPVEAVWAPMALCAIAAACFVVPDAVTPWVALAYLATSGYHYSGQTYGVSMIFLGKAGLCLTPFQKRIVQLPIYCSYLYTLVNLNVAQRERPRVLQTVVPVLGLGDTALHVCLALVIVSIVLYVLLSLAIYRAQRRSVPAIVHITVAAHVAWFTLVQYPILVAVVPVLHCLQYLLITVFFDFKETRIRQAHPDFTPVRYVASGLFAKYYVTQVAVGIALFVGLPFALTTLGAGPRPLVGAVVISILNLHHFILDGAIWKLRKPAVAQPLIA